MKSLLLVVILAVAASAAVIENNVPEGAQELIIPEGAQELIVPEGAEMTFDDDVDDEVVVNDNFPLPRAQSNLFLGNWNQANVLIARQTVGRRGSSGVVHDFQETIRGDSHIRIGTVQVREWGTPQGATVSVVAGGINQNFITLRFRSQRGFGLEFFVEVWRMW